MAPFKCGECDHYNNGEGTTKCLYCYEHKYIGHEKSRLVVEYFEENIYESVPSPEDFDCLYPTEANKGLWGKLQQLRKRDATMVIQSYFLEMTHQEIADYHSISRSFVTEIILKSIEKIAKL